MISAGVPAGAVTLQGGGGFGGHYDLTHNTYQHAVIFGGGAAAALCEYWEIGAGLQRKTSYAALIDGGPQVLRGEQAGGLYIQAGRKLLSRSLVDLGGQLTMSFWYSLYEHTEQALFYPKMELGPYIELRLNRLPVSVRGSLPVGIELRGGGAHRITVAGEAFLRISLGGEP